jgi:hypothetical protein
MKQCSKCKIEKTLGQFNKSSKRKDGLQGNCKDCNKAKSRQHYLNNKQVYRKKADLLRAELVGEIRKIKESSPCLDCNNSYPYYVMDFDHLEGEIKLKTISQFKSGGQRKKLFEEIKKCELVCSNCHRIRTYKRSRTVRRAA